MITDPAHELSKDIAEFYNDPLGFVIYAYHWGEGNLSDFNGPDEWQTDFLSKLGKKITANKFDGKTPAPAVQMAVSSGHGIGKSALVAWLVNWIMSTRPHCKGIVTANTAPQLETKTWAEIIKWTKRSITSGWFEYGSGKGSMRLYHKDFKESWRCDAITCREENSESFAGQHAINSSPFYIFDEASAIPNSIWDVAEGGLTDGEPLWFAFGNPTRNNGKFYDCFHKQKHRWHSKQIDSRLCSLPNKQLIENWREDYGEDSDFFKIRVRGLFPSRGHNQLIDSTILTNAMRGSLNCGSEEEIPKDKPQNKFQNTATSKADIKNIGNNMTGHSTHDGAAVLDDNIDDEPRNNALSNSDSSGKSHKNEHSHHITHDKNAALVIGVDVARFGADKTVIAFRHGYDGRIFAPLILKDCDTMQVSSHIAQILNGTHTHYPNIHVDATFIDGIGIGAGVVDRMRQLGFSNIIDVNSASSASDTKRYANKRAEMYDKLRQWLKNGGQLPNDPELFEELSNTGYGFDQQNRLLLEGKESIKQKGNGSPDMADAYALTFAEEIAPKDFASLTSHIYGGKDQSYTHDYDVNF